MSRIGKTKNLIGVICIMLVMCFVFTGCDSNKYDKANKLYEQGEYHEALKLYEKLGNYEDALDKVEICKKQIGMSENADNDFLKKIEESILNRLSTTRKEDADYKTLVNTELAYVEQFKDKTFYDKELKALADKYIEGLNIQKEALKKEYVYEYQIDWQKGLVYRCEVLKALHDKYNFLTDNADFIGTYVSQYEDQKTLLEAYYAIEKDIDSQINADNFKWNFDGYEFSCTVKNNTEYEYSTTFGIKFYDSNGTMYESDETYIENIKPGSSYVVSFVLEDSNRCDHYAWHNYYDDVKI